MHARMRRLVWSGDGTYIDATMAGTRQNMRVHIWCSVYVYVYTMQADTAPNRSMSWR